MGIRLALAGPSEPVSEQANGWDAAKIGAGIAALLGAFRYFFRGRSTNAHDRIHALEHQLSQLREELADIPMMAEVVKSINARMNRNEVGLGDLKREVRDGLTEIQETVRRALRKLDEE